MPQRPTPRTGPTESAWADPAVRHRLAGLAVYVGGSVLGVALVAGGIAGAGAGTILVVGLGAGGLAALLSVAIAAMLGDAVGAGLRAVIAPSGQSTPYQPTFSQQEALAAHGDVAGALASFEELIAGSPDGVEVRLRAAEMYAARGADPARAAQLLREVRGLPGVTASQDLYASNRLIDLYLGPLRDEGRALVECRRILDRHPRSPAAAGARQVIERVKRDRGHRTGDKGER